MFCIHVCFCLQVSTDTFVLVCSWEVTPSPQGRAMAMAFSLRWGPWQKGPCGNRWPSGPIMGPLATSASGFDALAVGCPCLRQLCFFPWLLMNSGLLLMIFDWLLMIYCWLLMMFNWLLMISGGWHLMIAGGLQMLSGWLLMIMVDFWWFLGDF